MTVVLHVSNLAKNANPTADGNRTFIINGRTGDLETADISLMRSSIVLTPQDFGAKGDGVTNDTAAFQAAIAACVNKT